MGIYTKRVRIAGFSSDFSPFSLTGFHRNFFNIVNDFEVS